MTHRLVGHSIEIREVSMVIGRTIGDIGCQDGLERAGSPCPARGRRSVRTVFLLIVTKYLFSSIYAFCAHSL